MINPLRLAKLLPRPMQWLLLRLRISDIHGTARWMTAREKKAKLSLKNDGFWLSTHHRMSAKDSYRNFEIVAPTGANKTVGFVIPNILKCPGSFVVADPSGEIYRNTAGEIKKRGYDIKVFQPAKPFFSEQYNPLARRKTLPELRDLARAFCNRVGSQSEAYWATSATTPLYITLVALSRMPAFELANLGNARWIINHAGIDPARTGEWLASYLPEDHLYRDFEAFFAQDHKQVSQHLGTVQAALEAWSDPGIAEVTAGDTINLEGLRERKTAIYMIVPEHAVEHYAILMNLLYADCFRMCYQNPDGVPVYFFLDEFANLGKIEGFERTITTLRKYRCSISIILQDPAQLADVYGADKARTIANGGIANHIFLPGLGIETCEKLERMLGKRTVYDTVFGGHSDYARTLSQPLIPADEIRMFPEDEAILVTGRERPARFITTPFFKDPGMLKMTQQPAPMIQKQKHRTSMQYLDLTPPDSVPAQQAFDIAKAVEEVAGKVWR